MKYLFAVVDVEGRPLDPSSLGPVRMVLDEFAHREVVVHAEGAFALAVGGRVANAPESPIASHGELVGAFVGRLDNRSQLSAALGDDAGDAAGLSDSDLVVRSVAKWGERCVDRFLGDFSLVVWDASTNRLVCARDHLGIVPLYYSRRGGLLVVATELRSIVSHPQMRREPNETFLKELLLGGELSNSTD